MTGSGDITAMHSVRDVTRTTHAFFAFFDLDADEGASGIVLFCALVSAVVADAVALGAPASVPLAALARSFHTFFCDSDRADHRAPVSFIFSVVDESSVSFPLSSAENKRYPVGALFDSFVFCLRFFNFFPVFLPPVPGVGGPRLRGLGSPPGNRERNSRAFSARAVALFSKHWASTRSEGQAASRCCSSFSSPVGMVRPGTLALASIGAERRREGSSSQFWLSTKSLL